jgi:Uma2 family endonuclease
MGPRHVGAAPARRLAMAAVTAPEPPARTGLTYEEWRKTPVTNQRQEVVEGELIHLAAPTPTHQWALLALARVLDDYARVDVRGVVLPAPMDVIIRREPRLQVRQPDIVYWDLARTGFGNVKAFVKSGANAVPDLAVEFLSPEEESRTLAGKLADYAFIGIREVWLVSVPTETVEVLALEDGGYVRAGLNGAGDTVMSTVLEGLDLPVDTIFED